MLKFITITFICLWSLIADIAFAKSAQKIVIKAASITTAEFCDKFISIGQIKNFHSKDFYSVVAGTVDFVIAPNTKVKAGDVIVAIDSKIADAKKLYAQDAYKLAEEAYNRNKVLFAKKFNSDELLSKSQLAFAQANLQLAEVMNLYNNMIIKAPFSGEIGVVKLRVGETISAGNYLFSITTNKAKTLLVEIPEWLNGKITNNSEVFIISNLGSKSTGKIIGISDYLSNNGFLSIEVYIKDGVGLLHNSYVKAELVYNKHHNLALPEQVVLKNEQGNFVYKISANDKIIHRVYIKIGSRSNGLVEIISPELQENDMVVLEGLTKVQEGSIVEILGE